MSAFLSTNGGQSWTAAVSIANAPSHGEARRPAQRRSAFCGIDGAGTVYLSWSDCSFESNCSANDIVYSSSTDGSSLDFEGAHSARSYRQRRGPLHQRHGRRHPHLGQQRPTWRMTYYYYPVSNCGQQLPADPPDSRMTSNGGQTWTAGRAAGQPMQLSWLPEYVLRQDGGGLRCDGLPGGRSGLPDLRAGLSLRRVARSIKPSTPSCYGYTQEEMTDSR